MRIKKKGLALWLALFLGVSSLSGCGGGDDGMTQLSEKGAEILNSTEEDPDTDVEPLKQKTKLPEDGIITQAQMETIAGKDESIILPEKRTAGSVINGLTMEARFRIRWSKNFWYSAVKMEQKR